MRIGLRRFLIVAATMVVAFATSLVSSTAAQAAGVPDCPANYICFYEDINFDGGGVGYHVSEFDGCQNRRPGDGWISSVHNNTNRNIELWDTSASPDYRVGTAIAYRYYPNLGSRGNDTTDFVASPGCPRP